MTEKQARAGGKAGGARTIECAGCGRGYGHDYIGMDGRYYIGMVPPGWDPAPDGNYCPACAAARVMPTAEAAIAKAEGREVA